MKVGEKIWHCKRLRKINAEISEFELPKEYTTRLRFITVQPLGNGDTNLLPQGEDINKYQKIIAQPYKKWYGIFKEGDRLFLDGKIPNEEDLEDMYAERANYFVYNVGNQNEAIRILAEKRTAE